jgi:hypothetical protein
MTGPLQGIKVVEITMCQQGPVAGIPLKKLVVSYQDNGCWAGLTLKLSRSLSRDGEVVNRLGYILSKTMFQFK